MDKVQIGAICGFSAGLLLIIAYFVYKFFLQSTGVPEIIKIAFLLIFFGLIVGLASVSVERLKEMKK